jgi:hypothetical protein
MARVGVLVLVLAAIGGCHRALATGGSDGAVTVIGADASADAGAPDVVGDGPAGGCGDAGQRPCPGAVCDPDDCIGQDGFCVPAGMPCGPTTGTCNGFGQGCFGGIGPPCGRIGQPCCGLTSSGDAFCSESGGTCVLVAGEHRCAACGRPGQLCCGREESCRQGTCVSADAGPACP